MVGMRFAPARWRGSRAATKPFQDGKHTTGRECQGEGELGERGNGWLRLAGARPSVTALRMPRDRRLRGVPPDDPCRWWPRTSSQTKGQY